MLYLQLPAIHGGDVSLFADCKRVGYRFVGCFGCHNKVVAFLLYFNNRLNIFGHFDGVIWQPCKNR